MVVVFFIYKFFETSTSLLTNLHNMDVFVNEFPFPGAVDLIACTTTVTQCGSVSGERRMEQGMTPSCHRRTANQRLLRYGNRHGFIARRKFGSDIYPASSRQSCLCDTPESFSFIEF